MSPHANKGIIAWFATNPVAANLLMMIIIAVGLGVAANIKRSFTPEIDIDILQITMVYPGAAPEEVEQGIVLRIEEALSDLDGIKRINSRQDYPAPVLPRPAYLRSALPRPLLLPAMKRGRKKYRHRISLRHERTRPAPTPHEPARK